MLTGMIAGVLLIVVGTISGVKLYPGIAFERAIKNEDSAKLAEVFRAHPGVLDSEKHKEMFCALIEQRTNAYAEDTISYDTVVADFENFTVIERHLIDNEILEITADNKRMVEVIHTSQLVFEAAEELYRSRNYQKAEANYSEVAAQDKKYYDRAQERLEEIGALKDDYLVRAEEKKQEGDYKGSIDVLTEGLTYFSYDEACERLYHDAIVKAVISESDYLMENGMYFSADGKTGAFNLVYSYLKGECYADNAKLQEKLTEIAVESESDELVLAEERLGLVNKSPVLDRCSDTAARDYYSDSAIQDDNSYILELCRNDSGVQSLLETIPEGRQINVALISDFAMTAEDFSGVSRDKLRLYADYTWDYTGIGRYFDEEDKGFSWAVILIYELE